MSTIGDIGHYRTPQPGAHGHGWRIAYGVLLVIAGALAILMPGIAALSTALLLGWLLAFGGIVEIAYAIHTRHSGGFGWKIGSGILTLILGVAILLVPLAAIASIGLLVAAFLFVGGVGRAMLATRMRPARGWGWILVDGIVSVVLAGLIALAWPGSSIAVIGVLVGFWLITAGIWRILLRHAP